MYTQIQDPTCSFSVHVNILFNIYHLRNNNNSTWSKDWFPLDRRIQRRGGKGSPGNTSLPTYMYLSLDILSLWPDQRICAEGCKCVHIPICTNPNCWTAIYNHQTDCFWEKVSFQLLTITQLVQLTSKVDLTASIYKTVSFITISPHPSELIRLIQLYLFWYWLYMKAYTYSTICVIHMNICYLI